MNRVLVVDGNSILNRAFYGIRFLSASDGTPTNAVYGFLNILFKYLDEEEYDGVCVAFDVKEKTFRHKMFEDYKAQRSAPPEELILQFPIIKDILDLMGYKRIELAGYEADDLIGTVAKRCETENVRCDILTGDKDDLQLASKGVNIKLVITSKGVTTATVYDDKAVFEKYGVTPSEFIDVKALMGDTSDNIPGVKGIGEKTALSLISQYKSVENIYNNFDEIKATPSVRKKLEEGRESAFMSRRLSEIDTNAPIEFTLDDFKINEMKKPELYEMFMRLNFKSFIDKLNLTADDDNQENSASKTEINAEVIDSDKAAELIKGSENIFYSIDFESNCLCFSADKDKIYMLKSAPSAILKNLFENEKIKKTAFSIKEDILELKKRKIEYTGLGFDVSIAAYILDPAKNSYEPIDLLYSYTGIFLDEDNGASNDGGQISMNFGADTENSDEKLKKELFAVIKLYEVFNEKLKENGQEKLYYDIELPLVEVLASMQNIGMFVDKNALKEFGENISGRITRLEESIYNYAGEKFNVNSPKQLGVVLFETLKLPHGKKTKTGYSTSADVLEKIKGIHPIIEEILEFRHLSKLKSTYVDGLLAVIDKSDGRIHSVFNQTVTATGRISSSEPNLQNIPIRLPIGREIRRMFTAEGENYVLVDADYSQIELRTLAHVADDANMQTAFKNNTDIHTQTASQVFGVELSEVTSAMRTAAKAVNFGIVYGIGEFSLSQDLGISIKEAKRYIENYLENYPSIKEYMSDIVKKGESDGYVSTIMGRRRYIPELKASNKITKAFGQRIAMNAPIQGSAADIIKIAMVNVYNRIKSEGLKSRLILQVHDELIIETEISETEKVMALLKEEMENAVSLSVPLVADIKSGKSWYDTK